MAIFRKIVVRNRTFLWAYIFDNDDHQNASQIIIKDCETKRKIIIQFQSSADEYHGDCPLNMGMSAVKDGKEVVINFNRPKYIAEILIYILDLRLHDDRFDTTEYYNDGIEILGKLGYIFDYHLQ